MLRQFKTKGIILKRTNTGEADRFLTVFTKERGKLSIYAKGIRKITSKRGSHVELFNHSFISVHEGKTHQLLLETESIDTFTKIRGNLKSVGLAYHVCEIVDKLTAEAQENQEVYNLLLGVLTKINNVRELPSEAKPSLIRNFEIDLLKSLGFLSRDLNDPDLDVRSYIEELIEKELKSKRFIEKLQNNNIR